MFIFVTNLQNVFEVDNLVNHYIGYLSSYSAWNKLNAVHAERCLLWYFTIMVLYNAKLQTAATDCGGLIVSVSDRQGGTESVTALFLTTPGFFKNCQFWQTSLTPSISSKC